MQISLKAITIFNFKSFRGEIDFPFIPPFTAIVGPNGSGKSNFMDAISFVMGENSRALRVKYLKELIHGAIIGKPVAQSAHVTATFMVNNEEKIFTRRVYRDSSQYKIDDQIVTNETYMTKLREYGLDIKLGNFLMYQGSMENIAMKTPRELTVMFEQLSGSIMYKKDYDRLKMELAEIKQQVHFDYHTKKQALMQKRYAVAEKAEAEEYLSLQERYVEGKLRLRYIRLFLIEKTIETIQDERRVTKSKIDEYLSDKKAATVLLEDKASQSKPLSHSLETVEKNILKLKNTVYGKRGEYAVIKENVLYWLKKRDCACISLDSANKAWDTSKRIIQETENDLQQVGHMLTEMQKTPQQSTVELSNSQVKRYLDLKNEVECRAKDFIEQRNRLMHNRQMELDKLDNANRDKEEREDKMKQKAIMKEEFEKCLKKLQSLSNKFKATLIEKAARRQELSEAIKEAQNKLLSLKNDIAKYSEELREAHVDKYFISKQMKKSETITTLKRLFSGVYGRLSDLCRPIHSRYNVAVTKVLGKKMDAVVVDNTRTAAACIQFLKEQRIGVETFLPLDSLKLTPLMEHLRDIKEPWNVKLLYDVLMVSSLEIDKAVLFVARNTLICETAEDARRMAYEIDKHIRYDCVSLDGSFYRRDGTFSGGQIDSIVRAKRWESQQISALMEQKAQLMREFNDLPNISLMQSEHNDVEIEIEGLHLKMKHIENDMKNAEDDIMKTHKASITHDTALSLLNKTISKIQRNIQTRDAEIADIAKHINAIEDEIFADFCRDINIENISYYERNNLRVHQQHEKRLSELRKQYDRILNQLGFENDRDTESKVSKWKRIMEQAEAELKKANEQDHSIKTAIARDEANLSKLEKERTTMEDNRAEMQKEMAQCRSQMDDISRLYLQAQKKYISLQGAIEQNKAERNIILKECKMEGITVPMLPKGVHCRSDPDTSMSSSSLNVESSSSSEASRVVDFSQLPSDMFNNTEENLLDVAKELDEKLAKIKNKMQAIENPNFKAKDKIDSITQQIQEITKKHKESCKKRDKIEARFTMVKKKRYQLFSDCLDQVAVEVDPIYQALVNSTSAQAFILSDNPEEPYEGNINYNCIAPFKRFQVLQNLSGGEKTFASLALLFAFHRYKPVPFFVMDEADAALDKANTENLVRFIQSHADPVSFITISLRRSLYFHANMLIGVTIEPNMECPESTIFTLSLDQFRPANPGMA